MKYTTEEYFDLEIVENTDSFQVQMVNPNIS